MNTHDTLLAFSEWLDGQGLIVSDQTPDADTRTHDQLAAEFIEQWAGFPLAGTH